MAKKGDQAFDLCCKLLVLLMLILLCSSEHTGFSVCGAVADAYFLLVSPVFMPLRAGILLSSSFFWHLERSLWLAVARCDFDSLYYFTHLIPVICRSLRCCLGGKLERREGRCETTEADRYP